MDMAMKEMSAVPANSGTAPNEPDEPTWSARIAICGLQEVPNRKSMGEMIAKNRKASKATDATMPIVVNTAIVEQPSSSHSVTRSTPLRARNCRGNARTNHDDSADREHRDEDRERHAADAAQAGVLV
jgi:hypothetical protein